MFVSFEQRFFDCRKQTGPPDAGNNLRTSHFIMCHVTIYSTILGVFQQPWPGGPGVSPIRHFERGEGPGDEVEIPRTLFSHPFLIFVVPTICVLTHLVFVSSRFNFQISKLEKALQQSLTDLHQKNEQIIQLESAVADQQNALKKELERMRDLEESRTHLQQQVSILEEEINRERNTSQLESSELQQRLQEAKEDIDERTRQINELNSTLREVHKDMKHSSASIVELEQLLQQSRTQCDKTTAQAQTLDQALKETRQQLSEMTKKNGELGERLRQTESEFAETTEQNEQLDSEVIFALNHQYGKS